MILPNLEFKKRDREYKSYQEPLRDKVIYEYLLNGKSRRWLDEKILGLDEEYSRGWQSFSILNYVGLTNEHKGIFKGKTIDEILHILLETQDKNYNQIISALTRYSESLKKEPAQDIFAMFTPLPHSKKLYKNVGSSQYTDGVRIDKEFHNIFNPPNSPFYTERGKARPIKILFNNKVFSAEYRFENQVDKSIVLQSIRFYKELKEEFKVIFPVLLGEFYIQQGADLNQFVFTHMVNFTDDEEEDTEYSEGKKAFRTHRIIERDPKVIKKAKEKFIMEHSGRLFCEVCRFDFNKVYGSRGSDFIEGHHKKMVSEMKEGEVTKVEDIALLCSNCHRMIHRKPFLTVKELARLIEEQLN